ncbi:mandelate racemase/muconate lactonizing enzyme family protein [Priestia abyssalis]|uniref:mandelate racemase/muconate lactonizing enzyme family protein n=1 Tax=Priestia abyssalis TaxID=1221450 RepID=UPI000995883D|nr:dipeptide epimerase [Priestia abyssalis]
MIISKAEVYGIRLPLKKPFVVSYASYDSIPSVIVKLTTDNGIVGYGEAVGDEHVTGESIHTVLAVLQHQLLPAVIGKNPFNIEQLHETMNAVTYRNPAAKAAVDIACYDLMGKASGQPVYNLLGGRLNKKLTYAKVLSIDEPENMADEAENAVAAGYSAIKVKIGNDMQDDLRRLQAIRDRIGYDVPVRADVNQGWKTCEKAKTALTVLESFQLSWLEQPLYLEDIEGMALLRKLTRLPIMADESVQTPVDLQRIIQHKAADKINIKLMKSGGIYPSLALAKIAESAGLSCQVGSMVESSIGSAAGYHLAISKRVIESTELTGPLLFSKDVGNLEYAIPYVNLKEEPGLGLEVNEDTLRELSFVHHCIGQDELAAR